MHANAKHKKQREKNADDEEKNFHECLPHESKIPPGTTKIIFVKELMY